MSLIKCPECGKKFSDKAEACPECSCPMSEINKINTAKKKDESNKKEKIKKSKNIKKQNIIETIKTDKRKRIILLSIVLIIIWVIISLLCLTVFNDNWKKANINYENAYKIAYKKNSDLEELITKSEKLVYSDNVALDEELRPTLETSISESKAALKELPKKSLFTKKINEKTKKLNSIDYEEVYNKLNQDYTILDKSIRKYKLVYQPKEAYVIECLKQVKHVKNIAAVTEDNDPNGKLNKPGGYTATVYYSDDRIKLDKSIYGKTVIDQGTDGGGAIEVYSTVEDATKRRDYLAAFDGGVLSNGSHTVIGTVLIRTSDELTASQQKEMESLIIEALTKLEEEKVENKEEQKETSTSTNKVESTKKEESTTKKENISFYGGMTSSLGIWNGKGTLKTKTTFTTSDEICFTGKISGFTGKKYITMIADFPDGESTTDTFDVQNGDVIGFGWNCNVSGKGSITIKLTSTGKVLGKYEFTIE